MKRLLNTLYVTSGNKYLSLDGENVVVLEEQTFTGGMSAVLGNRWTGGLRVEFEARNYAKRKDLRHKNTRLDFEFSPGIMYHAGRFAAGAVYIVGTNSEKVDAEGV